MEMESHRRPGNRRPRKHPQHRGGVDTKFPAKIFNCMLKYDGTEVIVKVLYMCCQQEGNFFFL